LYTVVLINSNQTSFFTAARMDAKAQEGRSANELINLSVFAAHDRRCRRRTQFGKVVKARRPSGGSPSVLF